MALGVNKSVNRKPEDIKNKEREVDIPIRNVSEPIKVGCGLRVRIYSSCTNGYLLLAALRRVQLPGSYCDG